MTVELIIFVYFSFVPVVVNVVMDVHNCFNRIIHAINPATVSRKPIGLCKTCKFAVREAAVGK